MSRFPLFKQLFSTCYTFKPTFWRPSSHFSWLFTTSKWLFLLKLLQAFKTFLDFLSAGDNFFWQSQIFFREGGHKHEGCHQGAVLAPAAVLVGVLREEKSKIPTASMVTSRAGFEPADADTTDITNAAISEHGYSGYTYLVQNLNYIFWGEVSIIPLLE